ncbi:MAG: methyltransferase domain-containing protein [Candidatus Omnitrophica bacterium]|nr:methyltransferase domain-containing protein [Candidatus Omnitrophota bacterium]
MSLISNFTKIFRDEYGFDTIAIRREALQYLNPGEPPTDILVLDVGTGSGWMAILAAEQGQRVISIDINPECLLRAKHRAEQALMGSVIRPLFVCADALRIPFPDNFFDAAISFDAVHHLFDCPCPAGIKEMIQVCKTHRDIIVAGLNKNGAAAVRTVHDRAGLKHEENRCDVEKLEMMLHDIGLHSTRRDTSFVTIFHAHQQCTMMKNSGQPRLNEPNLFGRIFYCRFGYLT